jgi:hypothetical protein
VSASIYTLLLLCPKGFRWRDSQYQTQEIIMPLARRLPRGDTPGSMRTRAQNITRQPHQTPATGRQMQAAARGRHRTGGLVGAALGSAAGACFADSMRQAAFVPPYTPVFSVHEVSRDLGHVVVSGQASIDQF